MVAEKIQSKVLKSFKFDNKVYNIVEPNLQVVRESKYRYSKSFTDAIKQGFYTKKKLEMVLKEGHADLIESHIDKRAKVIREMASTQTEISNSNDPDRLKYLAELMKIYREALFQEDLSMKSLFDATADSMADEERLNFLTYSLTRDENGTRLWESYEEFLEDNNFTFVEACRYELMCWEYKIDPNWQDSLPETEAIKKAESIIDEIAAAEVSAGTVENPVTQKKISNKQKKPSKQKKVKKENDSAEKR